MLQQTLTQEQKQQLETIMRKIKEKYSELKQCMYGPIQNTIIWQLRDRCDQAGKLMAKMNDSSTTMLKKRQIEDIRGKIRQVQLRNCNREMKQPEIGNGGRGAMLGYMKYDAQQFEAEMGHQADTNFQEIVRNNTGERTDGQAQLMMQQQVQQSEISGKSLNLLYRVVSIKSVQLKYSNEQLEEVYVRLKNNQQFMKQMEHLVKEQGAQLDKIEQNLEQTSKHVAQANIQLDLAELEQKKLIGFITCSIETTAQSIWGKIINPFKKMFKRQSSKAQQ